AAPPLLDEPGGGDHASRPQRPALLEARRRDHAVTVEPVGVALAVRREEPGAVAVDRAAQPVWELALHAQRLVAVLARQVLEGPRDAGRGRRCGGRGSRVHVMEK